jgi:hypothetical protein
MDSITSIIVKWREQKPGGKLDWFIRGIRHDGSFYGEVHEDSAVRRIQVNVQGGLSSLDTSHMFGLADVILRSESGKTGDWSGLLADGPIQRPDRTLVYRRQTEAMSRATAQFLSLIEILRPYVEAAYTRAIP